LGDVPSIMPHTGTLTVAAPAVCTTLLKEGGQEFRKQTCVSCITNMLSSRAHMFHNESENKCDMSYSRFLVHLPVIFLVSPWGEALTKGMVSQ